MPHRTATVRRALLSAALLLAWGLMIAGGLVLLAMIAAGLAGAWLLEERR